jgi:hypothetical protein
MKAFSATESTVKNADLLKQFLNSKMGVNGSVE